MLVSLTRPGPDSGEAPSGDGGSVLARKIAIDGKTVGDPHAAVLSGADSARALQPSAYQFLFGGPHHAPRGTTLELERA